MKAKTQRKKKTGGNNMKLLVTVIASRTPQYAGGYGGDVKGELYSNNRGDIKILGYTSDSPRPSELILKSVGTIPDHMLPLYKIAIEDGRSYSGWGCN